MAVQDDERENELRVLFGLVKEPVSGRSGTDAYLDVGGMTIPFELKSTTGGGVTTVRDFGPDHVQKWAGKHWLIGVYDKSAEHLLYSIYGSPRQMAPWIEDRREYVAPDFKLAEIAPTRLTTEDMNLVRGEKSIYSQTDAQRIQKRQYPASHYKQLMDSPGGYSPNRMLDIVRDRVRYLLLRGSTLNNPHIPLEYFAGWPHITSDHAETLRRMVLSALAEGN